MMYFSLFGFVLFLYKGKHLPCQDLIAFKDAFETGSVGGREGSESGLVGLYVAEQSTLRVPLRSELDWTPDSVKNS